MHVFETVSMWRRFLFLDSTVIQITGKPLLIDYSTKELMEDDEAPDGVELCPLGHIRVTMPIYRLGQPGYLHVISSAFSWRNRRLLNHEEETFQRKSVQTWAAASTFIVSHHQD